MSDQTTPAPQEVTQQESVDARLERFLGVSDEPEAPEAKEGQEPTPETPADELAPEDVEAEAPPSEDDGLELNHNGEIKRVSKEEARKLAQMGLDATQKWQAAAEAQRQNQEFRQALQAKLTIHPQIIDAAATVKAIGAQLQQLEEMDLAKMADEDPFAAQKALVQRDQLRSAYQQAAGQLQQIAQQAQQIDQYVDQAAIAAQMQRVAEALPEWRDPQRRAADQGRIRNYLKSEGIADQELDQLYDARHLIIARKAMLYDQAMKAKQGRTQKPSPSLTPGAAPPRQNEREKTTEIIKQLHQAKDPIKKKGLLDAALERKMARFIR